MEKKYVRIAFMLFCKIQLLLLRWGHVWWCG